MVCGVNVRVVQGLVEALDDALDEALDETLDGNTLQPRFDPAPGRCCARVSEVA